LHCKRKKGEKEKMQILNFIQINWVGWLFAALFGLSGNGYRLLRKQMLKQKEDSHAIKMGIQALLRQQIIDCHHKYTGRGICPIYAKESLRRVYKAYHNLGGNDVATELYEELLEMPVEKKEEKKEEKLC
jgi:hypothetical protein